MSSSLHFLTSQHLLWLQSILSAVLCQHSSINPTPDTLQKRIGTLARTEGLAISQVNRTQRNEKECGPVQKTIGGLMNIRRIVSSTLLGVIAPGSLFLTVGLSAQTAPLDRTVLPIAEPQYPHVTELDARNAKAPPRFEVKAPAKAPNVLIVLIDDMGFGQSSAFGGPIHMPTRRAPGEGRSALQPVPHHGASARPPARPC